MKRTKPWLVYLNGDLVPEDAAKVSIFDAGFYLGDTVFEVARTFNRVPFKLKEHLERLWDSIRSSRIDPGMSMKELEKVCLKVLQANKPLIGRNEDVWISVNITSGLLPMLSDGSSLRKGATVIVNCRPIPFRDYARFYRTGAHVVVASRRHIPAQCLDQKLKTRSRIYFAMAEREAKWIDPEAYPLLLDLEGNVAEATGANIFIVKSGVLKTPTSRNILCGVSRQTVMDLAAKLGIEVRECDFQVHDLINADEAFLTATSKCVFPISKVDNVRLKAEVPGPITLRLLAAWSRRVGLDIVGQALKFI